MCMSDELKSIKGWSHILEKEVEKDYFKKLEETLRYEYKNKTIYPEKESLFNALKLTSFKDIKVVIIGQDPYHGFNQANGLAFSVKEGVKYPPSLVNIFKELKSDLDISVGEGKSLVSWAKEGVLLINTVLTVRESEPNSHRNIGWERFTSFLLEKITEKEDPVVFILWGNNAREALKYKEGRHKVIVSSHPSPLSSYRSFFGSSPFSRSNKFLVENNIGPVNWEI